MHGLCHGTEMAFSVWKLRRSRAPGLSCLLQVQPASGMNRVLSIAELSLCSFPRSRYPGWDSFCNVPFHGECWRGNEHSSSSESCVCLSFGSILFGSVLFYTSHTWYHLPWGICHAPGHQARFQSGSLQSSSDTANFVQVHFRVFAAQFQMSSPSCDRHCDNETGKGQSRNSKDNERSEVESIHLTKGVGQSMCDRRTTMTGQTEMNLLVLQLRSWLLMVS